MNDVFWCLYCEIWTDFTHCSGVSIAEFELVKAGWEEALKRKQS